MAKITWSKTALNDIKSIASFIRKDSHYYAKIFVKKLVSSVDRLDEFPLSGRIVPEFDDSQIREVIYQNYRIIYFYDNSQIKILSIVHSKQNL
jgi:addiction module RelE/StbE family toxin